MKISLPTELLEAAEKASKQQLADRELYEKKRLEAQEQKMAVVREGSAQALANLVKKFAQVFPFLAILDNGVEERCDPTWWGSVFVKVECGGMRIRFSSSAWEWSTWRDDAELRMDTYIRIEKGELIFPEAKSSQSEMVRLGWGGASALELRQVLERAQSFFSAIEERQSLPLYKKFLRRIMGARKETKAV
jgi:hypothetical protein